MDINEVTEKWDDAARSDVAQVRIHPSAANGDQEYDRSGIDAAMKVFEVADAYLAARLPDIRVADFGCGDGRVAKHVVERFKDTWCVDASPTMLARLAKRVNTPNILLSNGVDGEMEFLGADLIYSWAVFIHHDHAGGRDILVGLANALSGGGFLALQIPCYEEGRERSEWIDVTVWTPELLQTAASRAGLEIVESWVSPGEFSYENVGENHYRLQVFRKPS